MSHSFYGDGSPWHYHQHEETRQKPRRRNSYHREPHAQLLRCEARGIRDLLAFLSLAY